MTLSASFEVLPLLRQEAVLRSAIFHYLLRVSFSRSDSISAILFATTDSR